MSQWLFKSPNNRIVVARQELIAGGEYSIMETTAGNEKIDHYGTYLVIVAEALLSFTLEVPSHFQGVTIVTVSFKRDAPQHSVMDFQQTGVEPCIVEDSWKVMFAQLKKILSQA